MKYYLIAGEASGDLHGSLLMEEIYRRDPQALIRFWGGERMAAASREGSALVKDYRDGAVMGFWEVFLKAFSLVGRLRFCKKDIAAWKPDAVVLIDYPGFNLKVAEFAHKAGFKVYYYIAPKVWASREGRIRQLKAYCEHVYGIFPFEVPYFQAKGVPFTYVGNPLVQEVDRSPAMQEPRAAFLSRSGLPDVPYVALLPGSRKMEITSMMPVYMRFADEWHRLHPTCHFVIAAAAGCSVDFSKYLGSRPFVHLVTGDTYTAIRHAQAAVVNSGTASLEAALIGTPQIVCYKVNPISAFIIRRIVKVRYASLVNLILNRPAVPELLQQDFTPERLYLELTHLLTTPSQQPLAYKELRSLL